MSDHEYEEEELERVTAPMQSFGSREVGVGLVVFLVGAAVTFGLPFVMA
jgi:hypothetical protein